MRTLLLDRTTWDLLLDAQGNLAVADDPYSQAQDAASQIKTFLGECYYDTSKGVPYWNRENPSAEGQVLGAAPPVRYVEHLMEQAALLVPGVKAARAIVGVIKNRQLTGQVQVTNNENQTAVVLIPLPTQQ